MRTSPHVFVNSSPAVLDNLKLVKCFELGKLFFGFYGKYHSQKPVFINLLWRVWVIFSLNFKTIFWRYNAFSLLALSYP